MEWLKRMNSVLDYIENNLDAEIDENKIAVLSASSRGMFQRIFAALTDMTLSEYIRKRKLTRAAHEIKNTDGKIIDIAVKYGYNSANAFSAAFKSFHGVKPSEARKSGVQLQSFQPFSFKITLSVKGGNDMQYRIIEAEDFLQKMVGNYPQEQEQKVLNNVWEHNGIKCACDGKRAAVILPEGVADWDLQDAYFEGYIALGKAFSDRSENCYNFEISKEKAAGLLALLEHFDDLNDDFKEADVSSGKESVFLDINTLEIMKRAAALELYEKPDERIIMFNLKYLREGLSFIMCSDGEYIDMYYDGSKRGLIMKSSRLYAIVLPCMPIK